MYSRTISYFPWYATTVPLRTSISVQRPWIVIPAGNVTPSTTKPAAPAPIPSVFTYVVELSATKPLAVSNTVAPNIVIAIQTFPDVGMV